MNPKKVFDPVPHAAILAQLTKFEVSSRALTFVRDFLTARAMHVRPDETRNSRAQSDPRCSPGQRHKPFLFNVVMAALPEALRSMNMHLSIINIYAYDVTLRANAPTNTYSSMH